MAKTSLSDSTVGNHNDAVSDTQLAVSVAQAHLASSLSALNKLIQIALGQDLIASPIRDVDEFLNGLVRAAVDDIKAKCQQLWLATCQNAISKKIT